MRISHVLLVVVAVGVASLWYFGQTRPIEIRTKSNPQEQTARCKKCNGKGAIDCPQCGRFGTLDSLEVCPTCKGTGKHQWRMSNKPDAPCQTCRGLGHIEGRTKCLHCEGKGGIRCTTCAGTGKSMSHSSTTDQTAVMGLSLWERFLALLHLSIEPNPCPQHDFSGVYPIVAEYVKLQSSRCPAYVEEFGKFKQSGDAWKMTATVSFAGRNGINTLKKIEFTVQNRELIRTRTVQ